LQIAISCFIRQHIAQSPAYGRVRSEINGKRPPIFPADFVLHSLRHTMLTRLGESPGSTALSFRNGIVTRHQKQLSAPSSDFNFQEKDQKPRQNDSNPYSIRYIVQRAYCK